MEFSLARHWLLLVLRGVAAILFGVGAFVYPGLTFLALTLLFGAYALVDGVAALVAAVTGHAPGGRWGSLLFEGLIGVAAGVVTFAYPGLTEVALLYLVAAWAVVTGVFEIVAAVRLRKHIRGEWLLGLAGVLSVLFGAAIVLDPSAGALGLVWLIASYSIAFGVVLISLGLRLRGHARRAAPAAPALRPAG